MASVGLGFSAHIVSGLLGILDLRTPAIREESLSFDRAAVVSRPSMAADCAAFITPPNMIKAMRLPMHFRISLINHADLWNRGIGSVRGGSEDHELDGDFTEVISKL